MRHTAKSIGFTAGPGFRPESGQKGGGVAKAEPSPERPVARDEQLSSGLGAAAARGTPPPVELLDRLQQGVVYVDRELTIEFANRPARSLLGLGGLAQGQQLPRSWQDFPLRNFAASLLERDDPATQVRPAGTSGAKYSLTGIPAGESPSAILILTDVSERERREQAQRDFITNAAHELQTPLTAIASAVEVLQAGAKEVPAQRDRFLTHIERETARLARLTRALLTLARAQGLEEQLRLETLELADLLRNVSDGLLARDGVDLEIDCPRPLLVAANRDLLEQAVSELVANAIKHASGGAILIAGRGLPDGNVAIEVVDAGPGIPPFATDHVFDHFYRADSHGREGFGLGLAIVRQIVTALAGTIELESRHGQGTVARVVIPGALE